MATSSEWLAAFAAAPLPEAPRWFETLGAPQGFRTGAPFAERFDAREPECAQEPVPQLAAPDALAEAEARGFASGQAATRAETDHELAHARALRLQFRALDEAARAVLAEELAATVEALCVQVLGDYALDGAALAARCEAAAARLGSGWAGAELHLHPDDAAGLSEGALAGWHIATDPALPRGALVIKGPDGAVRDTPDDWRRALAEVLRA
jgi:flagellar assembly protein FliH